MSTVLWTSRDGAAQLVQWPSGAYVLTGLYGRTVVVLLTAGDLTALGQAALHAAAGGVPPPRRGPPETKTAPADRRPGRRGAGV